MDGGRFLGSGSASRRTSRVTGAVSPSPKRMYRIRYTIGFPSEQPNKTSNPLTITDEARAQSTCTCYALDRLTREIYPAQKGAM